MKSPLPRHLFRPVFLAKSWPSSSSFVPAYPVFRFAHRNPQRFYVLSRAFSNRKALENKSQQHSVVAASTHLHNTQQPSPGEPIHLQSSLGYTALLLASTFIALGTVAIFVFTPEDQDRSSELARKQQHISVNIMSAPIPEGRPGNLTPDQEEKLRKLWNSVLHLSAAVDGGDETSTPKDGAEPSEGEHKKKRFGMFRKHKEAKAPSSPAGSGVSVKDGGEEDKYGQTKQFYETLANHSPETIRETIWTMVKHDHPDALLLRFLRARKWDVEKALVMLVSTMSWRHSEMHVDDDIMKNGEAGAVANANASNADEKRLGTDFMAQIRMGKSFLHGTDKQGRPICVVRVRLHKQGEQCEESLEKYTVYLIETARMVLAPPVDTATIIFDMTSFSMANMDYTPVKFMIKCFEANYPESLGAVLVHNAPWVFQGIWKIIRGWLDPVVAAKVHFTNNRSELEEFIHPGQILKELGGDENWEYEYVEPVSGENDTMKDTATRDKLLETRKTIVKDFESATEDWIHKSEGSEASNIKAERSRLATLLRENYWELDPYLRARSLYDRQGAIQKGGKVNWYQTKAEPVQTTPAVETSADDVD